MPCQPIRQVRGPSSADPSHPPLRPVACFLSSRSNRQTLPAEPAIGTWRAHHTLEAGCRFMAIRADQGAMDACRWGDVAHARLLGNRLLELDRFLSVLIDETLCAAGTGGARPLRNTARKLDQLDIMAGPDDARLRAIGRIAAVFRHCDGVVRNVAIHDDMRLAQGLQAFATSPGERGARLHMAPVTIVAICDFYREIGGRLLALAGRSGAAP